MPDLVPVAEDVVGMMNRGLTGAEDAFRGEWLASGLKFHGQVSAGGMSDQLALAPHDSILTVDGYEGGAQPIRSITLGKLAPNPDRAGSDYYNGRYVFADPDEIGLDQARELPNAVLLGPERFENPVGFPTSDAAQSLLGSSPVDPTYIGFDHDLTSGEVADVLRRVQPDSHVLVAGYETGLDDPIKMEAGHLAMDANAGTSYLAPHEFYPHGVTPYDGVEATQPAVHLSRPNSLEH